ncbi:hypothetical protein Tco_0922676 [Tanacetum coccineum]|uniref:Uncharacterized protein n=1 Tax=Tanacetum coccineum TaxID=301880 RepID=A0ABQ5D0C2_9ASTR
MSSDNASSGVTYTSISSDSNRLSWGIPLVNVDELPKMDPYEEDTDANSIDYPDKPEDGDEDPDEDNDEDPEKDPSKEHDYEDDDEDPEEDPSEEHKQQDEDTREEEPF